MLAGSGESGVRSREPGVRRWRALSRSEPPRSTQVVHPLSPGSSHSNDLLDSTDYAADTNNTASALSARLRPRFLGGNSMKRLFLVLALLAAAAAGGCRACSPQSGYNCGNDGYGCGDCCDDCGGDPSCCADSCAAPCNGCCDECRPNMCDNCAGYCPPVCGQGGCQLFPALLSAIARVAIVVRRGAAVAAAAMVATTTAHPTRTAAGAAVVAAVRLGRVAVVPRATNAITLLPAHRSHRRLIPTTRSAARATSCRTTRSRWGPIEERAARIEGRAARNMPPSIPLADSRQLIYA